MTGLSSNPSTQTFQALARDYFEETFDRFPVQGTHVGLRRCHRRLGRATPDERRRQLRRQRTVLKRIEALPWHDFEGDDLLDRLTLQAHLRTELLIRGSFGAWRINPQVYLETVAEGLHLLLVRHAQDLRPVAAAIVSRLRAVPRFLDEAIECLDRPIPLWTRLAGHMASGVVDLIRSIPKVLKGVTTEDPERLDHWAEQAVQAVESYARRIKRLKPGPDSGFSLGRERFETLIRERLGLALTPDEAVAAAQALAEKLKVELAREARRFHPRRAPHEILAEAAHQWRLPNGDLLGAYRRVTEEIRRRFASADVLTFPEEERLQVRLAPEFMRRHLPTAAYSSPGPFDPNQTGIFWINDLSLRAKTPEAKRREIEQHFGLELTSVHEAYPGHHLQLIWQNQHPRYVRKLADHAVYYEGWTLWCEQMAVDLKVSDNPYLKLIQLNDALWRANRIIIDCGLHTGAMSYRAACRRLVREVGFTPARARTDVNWYTASPAIPMSYLLGKMEVLRLKRMRVDQQGWSLRRFNDWFLSFGAIPPSWIVASGL